MAPIILDRVEFVEIAAGWFWMGWDAGHPGERPRHRVWVDAFAIARSPVTNREYAAAVDAGRAMPPAWWTHARFRVRQQVDERRPPEHLVYRRRCAFTDDRRR
mgnify:CR=1 FL=1